MTYEAMERHGGTLNTHHHMKEASLIRFQLYDTLEKTELRHRQ